VNETLNPPGSLPPRSSHALPPGSVVGDYEIQGLIGEGRSSIVYRALDNVTQREVAVKEYMPRTVAGRTFEGRVELSAPQYDAAFQAGLESFVDEGKLLAQFDHKALVKVLRLFEAYDTAYMVMPLYEGRTLKQILLESPTLDEPSLKAMLAPLLDALETLHGARCFHCDVCAENILILDEGLPVLLDSGAPHRVIGSMTQGLADVARTGYAPVEQYDSTMQPGPWTDIYALAALVRLAITGKLPPPSVTRVRRDAMRPLALLGTRFGPTFLRAVDRGLAVQPIDRPQSIAEFRRALGLAVVSVRLPMHALHVKAPAPAVAHPRGDAMPDPPRALEPAGVTAEKVDTGSRTPVSPASAPAAMSNYALSRPVPNPVASSARRGLYVVIGLVSMLLVIGAGYFVVQALNSEPPDESATGESVQTAPAAPPSLPEPAPTQQPAALEPPPSTATAPAVASQSPQPADAPPAAAPPAATVAPPAAPPPATGLVKLDVKPWGEVLVDGRARGLTPPLKTIQLPEGTHRVEVRNPVGPPLVREIRVTASGRIDISHTFE
jgi:serine/threonine protein kinase